MRGGDSRKWPNSGVGEESVQRGERAVAERAACAQVRADLWRVPHHGHGQGQPQAAAAGSLPEAGAAGLNPPPAVTG